MAIRAVEELVLRPRVGGGGEGGAVDDSDDLSQMRYSEKLVYDADFLKLLSGLKVASEETIEHEGKKRKRLTGGLITLQKEDIPFSETDRESGLNGVCHMINKTFVAMGIPFEAKSFTSDDAKPVTKELVKGERKGETDTKKEPDYIRIQRVSEKFEVDRYAIDGSIKTRSVAEGGKGSGTYQQPTTGMIKRAAKWINQNVDDLADIFDKIGVNLESE